MKKEINKENLVKLRGGYQELFNLSQGRLIYIDHPKTGYALVDDKNVFVNTVPITKEQFKELCSQDFYEAMESRARLLGK